MERIRLAGLRLLARLIVGGSAAAVLVALSLASIGLQKAMLVAAVAGLAVCAASSVPPLPLMIVAGGVAITLMLDSSQSIGQLSGALVVVLVAWIAFNLTRSHMAFSPAAVGFAVKAAVDSGDY